VGLGVEERGGERLGVRRVDWSVMGLASEERRSP
jgi:hypothetical protein